MTETKSERRPRRDADGRLVTIGDLLGVALAGLVCGVVVLLLFEGVLSLFRMSAFGATSGWLALILPVWLFTEEFRAARGSVRRLDLRSAGRTQTPEVVPR
jgi:predicted RecA/RadA family phage recombinase